MSHKHVFDLKEASTVRSPGNAPSLLFIGDVHGCFDQLESLLKMNPDNRMVGLVGDLINRGPKSAMVLDLAMQMVSSGRALSVRGNHDDSLLRCYAGVNYKMSAKLLAPTRKQIEAYGGKPFKHQVMSFLNGTPSAIEWDDLVLVHAAYLGSQDRTMAIYGLDGWESLYQGTKHVVHGHVPQRNGPSVVTTASGARLMNIDTGCLFKGGALTGLLWPEMKFLTVDNPDGVRNFHS